MAADGGDADGEGAEVGAATGMGASPADAFGEPEGVLDAP